MLFKDFLKIVGVSKGICMRKRESRGSDMEAGTQKMKRIKVAERKNVLRQRLYVSMANINGSSWCL